MKNLNILLTFLSILLCACAKQEYAYVETVSISVTCATETRAYFPEEDSGTVHWNTNDFLWVFDGSGKPHKFIGPSSATNVAVFTCSDWPAGHIPQYALYNIKYNDSYLSEGKVRAMLLPEQKIVNAHSFSKYSHLSIGQIKPENGTYSASMKNICGLLKIRIEDDGIQEVRISGNDGDILSGIICITYNDGNPSYEVVSKASDEVVLIPRISNGTYRKGTYYICMLPQTLEKGVSISLKDENGLVADKYSTNPLKVERNGIVDLGTYGSSNMEFRKVVIDSPMEIDFSRVGYHYGEDAFPSYGSNIIYLEPKGNGQTIEDDEIIDRTDDINNAINNVAKPGTVVLKAGRYYVAGQVKINKSNVILRGETLDAAPTPLERNLSTIIGTTRDGTNKPSLVVFGILNSEPVVGTGVDILNARLPEGSMSVLVRDADEFSVGERVLVCRPDNEKWRHDLGMDCITNGTETYSWTDYGHTFGINAERIITAKKGNVLYFDAPLPMSIDARYGGGQVCHFTLTKSRISESGIEYINLDNFYDETITSTQFGKHLYEIAPYPADENHYWNGVRFFGAEHCWAKGVTASHFAFSAVSLYGHAKNITVEDCHSYEPVSLIDSPRRYAFALATSQLCLIKDCTADKDRHQFVTTGVYSVGPHVFLNCTATNSYSNAGPHSHWATCILYDGVKTDHTLSVEDAGHWGYASGAQGWQGANHVFWNCESSTIVCQNPQVSARNWAWGCIGDKEWGSLDYTKNEGDRPDGQWYSHGAHIEPGSLYLYQLEQRLASGEIIMKYINH